MLVYPGVMLFWCSFWGTHDQLISYGADKFYQEMMVDNGYELDVSYVISICNKQKLCGNDSFLNGRDRIFSLHGFWWKSLAPDT